MTGNGWVLDGLKLVKPELAMVVALVAVILVDLTSLKRAASVLTVIGLAAAGWLTFRHANDPATLAFRNAYAIDSFAAYFKLTFLAAALVVSIFSVPAIKDWTSGKGEFFALLLSCTFGMML